MSIAFEKPKDTHLKNKVTTITGKDYFLEKLTPDQFEELIYHLYKNEIELGQLKTLYDDIWLLAGVRDRGRDAALFINGTSNGVIQCKHSENPLDKFSKSEFVREIIKFVIHSLLDKRLIADNNNFTYYIVVSSGFSTDTIELLEDFNTSILLESELQKWSEAVIKDNITFQKLSYFSIEKYLKEVLSKIKVRKILSTDIQLLLTKEYNNPVVVKYFEVKTLVNNDAVQQGVEEIKQAIDEKYQFKSTSNIPIPALIEEIRKASFHLSTQKNEFENIPESHIERKETVELLNWVKTPLFLTGNEKNEERNIALLVGNAGCGKTVILKDLYTELSKDGIPVIGIKSDKYYVSSIKELEDKLNLKESIDKIIQTLKTEYEHIVILIDQLDALSQTLSGKREYLDTFNYLINEIKRIDKVRIIISVRTYDLNYDPELQNYRNHKTIKVSSLKPEEVDSILRKLGITYFSLSVQLKNLLSIPNNLNVFCKIYHASLNINSIGTLHDLYDKLWEQKILRNIILNTNSTKVKSFLFRLAAEMNSQQKIALNAQIFFDEYYNEINYLSSERIIQKEGEQLQFFHQTFYDYIFAKQFIEKGQSVEQFILQNNNGLFIRSSLKMIISFLSDYNHNLYLTTFENILKSKDFKFHIKLLLINLLGFEENPSKEEIEFVKVTILKRKKFNPLFIESVNTREWLNLLIQEGILNDLIAKANSKNDNLNLCYQTLSRFLPRERDLVLTYLNSMPEFATKKTFISRLLYFLTEWDNPIGFKLFKESFIEDNEDSFSYYKILEDVTEYDPLWVIEMLKIQLIKRMSGTIADKRPDNSNRDYHENKILEKLYEKDSVSTFNFSYELVELMINKYKPKGEITKNYNDLKFMLFDYQRAERSHGQEHIFYMMIYTLENFAKENTQEFLKIYEKLKNSYSKTFQRLLIYGLIQNPVELKNEIFEFILEQHRRDGFTLGDNVDYQLRQLIKATYKYLNQSQKNQLNKLILSINPVNERKTFTYKNKIMTPGKFYGQTKIYYLESLPPDEIYKNPDLKKTYLELKRKFANTINEKEPNSLRMYGVDPPLSKNAYQEMSLENWITTFKKYNTEHHSDPFSHIGGMTEHGRRFKDEVKKRPHHFSPLIEQLINEEIPLTYLIEGINGLKEANYDPVATMEIFKKAILKKMPRFETMQLIWATEYFTHHQTIDYEVLDFLCYNATNNEDPKIDEGDPLQHGINTVRGAAVERLVKISFNPDFSDKIFETLLKACDDPSLSVRISMMPHMALLMNLDRAKTFELFLKATKHNEEQIIKYSTWSASYLLNIYFDQLKNYFERAIEHESVLEDLAILLAAAWLKNKEGSFELLQIVLNESNKAKSKMVDVSLNNMIEKNGKLNPKCVELYCMFLGNTDDLIAKEYGDSFIHLKPENFKKFLPVLKKYSKSKTGTVHLQYFFDYLMKCVKKYPKECLQLISNYKKHEKPNIGQGDSSDDRIKVVIGIYNSLREAHVSDKKYFDKALSIFDFMLQDPSYRRDAYRVIQEVEL